MLDLYLIAHKVSGEPAFDVAQRIGCAECCAAPDECWGPGCVECDGLGYWWIIPTSGHRAYPYWNTCLEWTAERIPPMPPDLPDHYPHSTHTEAPKQSLADRLGLTKRPPMAPILRRL